MRPAKPTLTEQELEIMKVIWKLDTATVRQVYETLLEHRRIAYTTVMTMMNILEQKGYLKKEQAVRAFVNRVFNGSAEPLLVHLVEDRCLTEGDLEEIRRTIQNSRKASRRQK